MDNNNWPPVSKGEKKQRYFYQPESKVKMRWANQGPPVLSINSSCNIPILASHKLLPTTPQSIMPLFPSLFYLPSASQCLLLSQSCPSRHPPPPKRKSQQRSKEPFKCQTHSFIPRKGEDQHCFFHYHQLHEKLSHKKIDKDQNFSLKLHCRQWAITDNDF